MCLPACVAELAAAIPRRAFIRRVGVVAGAAALPTALNAREPDRKPPGRVVDLTHTLGPDFPSYVQNSFSMEQVKRKGPDEFNAFRWQLYEHVGTHLDAPLHFSDGESGDRIPIQNLTGPLAVVDIRERATKSPDTQLTLDDLRAWEKQHGRIPDGAVVALFSGWDAFVGDANRFLGRGKDGVVRMPGFSVEAVQFLQEERSVVGIVTDTYNLDSARAKGFPVHHYWLGHGKWGVENVANLGLLPAHGSTIVVAGPKIAGCTGGPSRVLALL